MTLAATTVGIALIAIALRDVFDTLFHPHGRGVISERLTRFIWRLSHAAVADRTHLLSLAGPIAFLLVVLSWVTLVVVGAALVIAPHMPEGFAYANGLREARGGDLADSIYLSLVNLTSLGYGDIVPRSAALRMLGPVETMIGLGILTASISWILSIYRVLGDYRSLGREIDLLADAQRSTGESLAEVEPGSAAQTLEALTAKLVSVRRDLVHFPIAYYFHSRDPRYELANAVPYLIALHERVRDSTSPAVRLHAARLSEAVGDLLATVDDEFLHGTRPPALEIVARWQRDHRWRVPESVE